LKGGKGLLVLFSVFFGGLDLLVDVFDLLFEKVLYFLFALEVSIGLFEF
jgi:hypothetical protein